MIQSLSRFCTDVEHIDGIDPAIVELAKDADLLIHDGQYTPEEYKRFKGWGHSSFEHAAEVAIKANVKRLIITHHDPDHNDDMLDAMQCECQKLFPNSMFAMEGMEVAVYLRFVIHNYDSGRKMLNTSSILKFVTLGKETLHSHHYLL